MIARKEVCNLKEENEQIYFKQLGRDLNASKNFYQDSPTKEIFKAVRSEYPW